MALEPLPPSNTDRYWLDYSANDEQHSMLMRTSEGKTAVEAADAFDIFLLSIDGNLTTITVIGMRFAPAGSDITNPVDTGALAGTYGSGVGSVINVPLQVTFPGRSTDGRKNFVSVFGWTSANDSSWRILSGEDEDVAGGVAALNSLSSSGLFVTISGQRAFYKPYANIGYNDYWVGQARG